jgi:hypothetical protein
MPRDKEFYALLYGVHSDQIVGHKYRGYILFNGMYDKTQQFAVRITKPSEKVINSR